MSDFDIDEFVTILPGMKLASGCKSEKPYFAKHRRNQCNFLLVRLIG